ncbi:MAG TPA: MDR family MFS transporter [Acidimicrobiales bacterium]|nr:MDR family MFS transporter [Acidimicrobiales bacterium]
MTATAPAPADPTAPAPGEFTHRQVLVIFSGLLLGMLLAALDSTIVATALPTIVSDLGGLDHISWVVTAYLLTMTIATPLYGKLGDLYGRKRLFQIAIAVFIASSALCGLATSMAQLIAFRALQGVGAGGLIVLGQAIIADVVSPRERGRYQGLFGAVFGGSSVAGPLLGGFFTDHATWRWVFYINVPLGLLALFVTAAVLPASPRRLGVKVDRWGALLLSGAVAAVILVTTWGGTEYTWGDPLIVSLIVAGAVLTGAFVAVELRVPEPLLPLRLFRFRTFALASGIGLLLGMAMYGAINYLPLFLQTVNGASATDSGLLLVPLMFGMVVSSTFAGALVTRTGRYRIFPVIGTALITLGLGLLGTLDGSSTRLESGAYMVVVGVGMGFTMQIIVMATQNEVPRTDLGIATSAVNFFRSIGGSIGVALVGAIFSSRLAGTVREVIGSGGALDPGEVQQLPPGTRARYVEGFADALTSTFWLLVPVLAVAVGLALLLRERPLRTSNHEVHVVEV